ncbi:UNVERIFIED_CONTAM: hypothetical protein NCL1_10401 [Trichonephila clavipes]
MSFIENLNSESNAPGNKGHSKSNYEGSTSHSNLDSVLSKFIDKIDTSKSHPGVPQRMCVISPPINGKLGVIYGSPSPSSGMKKLNLSAPHSTESLHRKSALQLDTPYSSPASVQSKTSVFVTPQTPATQSPNGTNKTFLNRLQTKRVKFNVLMFTWCGNLKNGVLAQVLPSSLDPFAKLRSPLPNNLSVVSKGCVNKNNQTKSHLTPKVCSGGVAC